MLPLQCLNNYCKKIKIDEKKLKTRTRVHWSRPVCPSFIIHPSTVYPLRLWWLRCLFILVVVVVAVVVCVVAVNFLTFRTRTVCVQVEHSSQQSHFLQDDSEAVNISFLSPTGGGVLHPQQLWGCPQLPWGNITPPGQVQHAVWTSWWCWN